MRRYSSGNFKTDPLLDQKLQTNNFQVLSLPLILKQVQISFIKIEVILDPHF